jgi:plastocyanin
MGMSAINRTRVPRTAVAAAAVAAALIGTVASLAATVAPAARKPKTHTIIVDAASFSPSALTVAAGDSIVWVNRDILAHTATTTDTKKPGFDSKIIQPGKSWKYTAKRRGEFPYTCAFHPMNGTITVK